MTVAGYFKKDSFLFDRKPYNFAVVGKGDYYMSIECLLRQTAGYIPTIIVHNGNETLVELCGAVCHELNKKICICDNYNKHFEPFLGMTTEMVLTCLSNIASKYVTELPTDFFKAARSLLNILELHNDLEYCLKDLFEICSIESVELLRKRITALDCDVDLKNRIISDLMSNSPQYSSAFTLIKQIVLSLSIESEPCGWDSDLSVRGTMNIISAVRDCSVLCIDVDDLNTVSLKDYFASELQFLSRNRFIIIWDSISVQDSDMLKVLGGNKLFKFGLICGSLTDLFGDCDDEIIKIGEKIERWIVMKHFTWTAAEKISMLIGTEEVEKSSESVGEMRQTFDLISDRHNKTRTTTKTSEYRVRPEQIQNLSYNQAILFDAESNRIL